MSSEAQSKPSRKRREDPPDVKLSKSLSQTLRHGAEKQGFKVSREGYITIDDLLSHSKFKPYTFEDIKRVVNDNAKQRFKLSAINDTEADLNNPSHWKIKANQGHSLKSVEDPGLKQLIDIGEFPKEVIHGTNLKAWELIKQNGLSKMKRNHIHMASGKPSDGNVISGMRKDCKVFIYINYEQALKEGIKFYISENGVILSEGDEKGVIPSKLFLKVEGV